jgi:hypothetical protein
MLKHAIRSFAIWLEMKTVYWVVPRELSQMVRQGKFEEARKALDTIEKSWPNDPEVTYARTLVSFLSGEE